MEFAPMLKMMLLNFFSGNSEILATIQKSGLRYIPPKKQNQYFYSEKAH